MKILSINVYGATFKSTSRASGNLRSQMLKKVMPKFSGDRGKALEKAFAAEDSDTIRKILSEITNELAPLDK